MVMEKSETEQRREIAGKKRLLTQKYRRVDELDTLFERLYEDHVVGKLTDERFTKMSAKYEQEQKDIRADIVVFEAAVAGQETQLGDVDKFLAVVRKYTKIQVLSPATVNELIDRIIVHEPEKSQGNRSQRVDIVYNGVGVIDLSQLQSYIVAAN
jgi:hypothetical protein